MEGAGNPAWNGKYVRDGEEAGCPRWRQAEGSNQGILAHSTSDGDCWCLYNAGYSAYVIQPTASQLPRTSGWKCQSSGGGAEPAPTLRVWTPPQWQQVVASASWERRFCAEAVSFRDGIFLIGGGISNLNGFREVWRSTDGGAKWDRVAQPGFQAQRGLGLVVHKDPNRAQASLYIFGGYGGTDNGGYGATAWRSDDGVSWELIQQTCAWANPQDFDNYGVGRAWSGVVSHRGMLFLLGGWHHFDGPHKNDVWRSSDGVTWEQVLASAPWPRTRAHGSVVSVGEHMYLLVAMTYTSRSRLRLSITVHTYEHYSQQPSASSQPASQPASQLGPTGRPAGGATVTAMPSTRTQAGN